MEELLPMIMEMVVALSKMALKSLIFLLGFIVVLLTITLVQNFYTQKRALHGMKDMKNYVTRSNFRDWRKSIKRYKNFAVFPYILFLIAFIVGVYYVNLLIIVASLAFFAWKQISLFWPCTYVLTREGIYFSNPFIMSIRKNYPDKVLWSEVQTIHYDVEAEHLIIQTEFEVLHYPMKEDESIKLRDWLSTNFLNRFISHEYANYKQ